MTNYRVVAGMCLLLSSTFVHGQTSVQRLKDIKKIYVGSFGDGDDADLIRSKIISHLVKSGRIEVLENEEKADAILTGVSRVTTRDANASGGTNYHATAGVRLLNRDSKILWADDSSNNIFSPSVTSSIADRISKKLIKAITDDEKKK